MLVTYIGISVINGCRFRLANGRLALVWTAANPRYMLPEWCHNDCYHQSCPCWSLGGSSCDDIRKRALRLRPVPDHPRATYTRQFFLLLQQAHLILVPTLVSPCHLCFLFHKLNVITDIKYSHLWKGVRNVTFRLCCNTVYRMCCTTMYKMTQVK